MIETRVAEDGGFIRRRRQCSACLASSAAMTTG